MIKVSVIVPCYNVEKYVSQCLDSVLRQTLKDTEIICINDGSTDKTQHILSQYAKKDPRIQIISQQNHGLGATRNIAIRQAKGKYLFFLDSDDWLDETCLEKLYNKIQQDKADICIYGCTLYQEDQKKYLSNNYYTTAMYHNRTRTPCDYHDIKDSIFKRFEAWLKLWNKDFFVQNNLYFGEGTWFEDIVTHVKGIILAKKITFVDENLYFYRQRTGSIMKTNNNPRAFDIFIILEGVLTFLKEKNLYKDLIQEYDLFVREQITYHYNRLNPKLKKEFVHRLKVFSQNHLTISDKDILSANKKWVNSFWGSLIWSKNDKYLKVFFLPIFRLKFNPKKEKCTLKICCIPIARWKRKQTRNT